MEQIDLGTLPRTREKALLAGFKNFFPERPCRNGHIAPWDAKYNRCRKCATLASIKSRQKRPEAVRQYNKDYYQKNREQEIARATQWWRLNIVHFRARTNAYRKARRRVCPHIYTQYGLKRRAQKRSAVGLAGVARSDLAARFSLFGGICAYCGKAGKMEADHFLPLAAGGTHTPSNIVPACKSCNCSKKDRDPEQWFRAQPFFTEKRWQQILKAVGKAGQHHGQLSLL